MNDLEKRLAELEKEQQRQDHDLFDLRDLEEIARLEKELEQADVLPPNVPKAVAAAQEEEHDFDLLFSLSDDKPKRAEHGYIICLMFNQKSPSEWSDEGGGGWRESGKGACYERIDQVQRQLQVLQSQFPDYPLKVARR